MIREFFHFHFLFFFWFHFLGDGGDCWVGFWWVCDVCSSSVFLYCFFHFEGNEVCDFEDFESPLSSFF